MKRRRHTPKPIIRRLREADGLLARKVPEVAKQLEISEVTYPKWRPRQGALRADDEKRLKELEATEPSGAIKFTGRLVGGRLRRSPSP